MWYLLILVPLGFFFALIGYKMRYCSFLPFVRIARFNKDNEDKNWRETFVKSMKRSKKEVIITTIRFYTLKYKEIQKAIRDAVSRKVEITIYYPTKIMPKETIALLEELGTNLTEVPDDTFGQKGEWNHIMLIDNRDWVYLPTHPSGKPGVHEGQIGINDVGRAKTWRRLLEKNVAEAFKKTVAEGKGGNEQSPTIK